MTADERLAAMRGTASPDVAEALRRALAKCSASPRPFSPVETFAPVPSRPAPFMCPGCGALTFAPLAEAAHVCEKCGARWTAGAEY